MQSYDKPSKIKFTFNKNKFVNNAFDLIKTIILAMIMVSVIFTLFVREANVEGSSMQNTLQTKDRVFLTNFLYQPKNGDIVVINAENLEEKRIIKRVIAIGNQTLRIDYDTGNVYVDEIKIDEPYISSETGKSSFPAEIPYTIPKGYIFVMGDNRAMSKDSRNETIGLVSVDDVIGKAQFVFYPFDRAGYLY